MKNGNDLGVVLTAGPAPAISQVKSMPAASKQKNLKSNNKGVEERSLGSTSKHVRDADDLCYRQPLC